jgi:hypothetical protein
MGVEDATNPSFKGKILFAVEQLINARTFVPELLKTTTQKRNAALFTEPRVAPVEFVLMDSAEVCATSVVVPVDAVALR